MSGPQAPAGTAADQAYPLAAALRAVESARGAWLWTAVQVLRRHPWVTGVWVVGSLGRGDGDAFSDVDLVVAVDTTAPPTICGQPLDHLGLPGTVLYSRGKPRNAPAGGAYLAVCLELAGLPVLADVYLWPAATAAVPIGARVLHQQGDLPHCDVGFLDLLARHPPADTTGADPGDPASVLFLVQLAAKYHARGDDDRRAAICRQLHLPDQTGVNGLRHHLQDRCDLVRWPQLRPALDAAYRLLDLADACRRSPSPTDVRGLEPPMECSP